MMRGLRESLLAALVALLLAPAALAQTLPAGSAIVISGAGTRGGGTVTSISNSDGTLALSPNPIIGTGTIGLALSHANTWTGQQTFVAPVLGAATGTSLALGGCTIGTDALCASGTTSLGNVNVTSSTVPANGVYLRSSNTLGLSTAGVAKWAVSTGGNFFNAAQSTGATLETAIPSSTVPSLVPRGTDSTTGIGSNASGVGNLIGGGVNILSWSSTGPVIATLPTDATHTDATLCRDTTSGAVYSGTGTLGICLGTSSARYKTNIADLPSGLDQIMALRPRTFNYASADYGDPSKLQYGFIAEEAQSALPDLVGLDDSGQPNTFDYLGVVPVLVKALQQQQAEIAALQGAAP